MTKVEGFGDVKTHVDSIGTDDDFSGLEWDGTAVEGAGTGDDADRSTEVDKIEVDKTSVDDVGKECGPEEEATVDRLGAGEEETWML